MPRTMRLWEITYSSGLIESCEVFEEDTNEEEIKKHPEYNNVFYVPAYVINEAIKKMDSYTKTMETKHD